MFSEPNRFRPESDRAVIEAVAAHRPYRAALGIERALAEIEGNSGRLYDEDVARACSTSNTTASRAERSGGAFLPLRVAGMHPGVSAVRRGFRVADVHRQAHVLEHRAERRQA